MAELKLQVHEGTEGIAKQIEDSALSLIFDNVQKSQYSEPEKSTIRELVSNGLDAISEKLVALDIIHGRKTVEEVFLNKEEAIYADSKWMPEYYDPQWLDTENNNVVITYYEALPGVDKDYITISDNGVGIGHIINPKTGQSRLQGVLKLGYSTKRLNNVALGKFGIGAKAALSTGVESYTMITRHNGREYHFEVYDYKAVPIVPKFNMETEQENPSFVFNEGKEDEYRGYYLPTDQKNGTMIKIQAARYTRKFYENGVRNQLLYFKNIDFFIHRESGIKEEIDFKAEILFENEFLIIPKHTPFSKPHMVLNGVNYGYINFERLELNEKVGGIAYKVKPEAVTVHPSRESLIWDNETRKTVLLQERIVADIAADLLQKEMVENDLIRWIRKGTMVMGDSRDEDSVMGKLLGQVDQADKAAFQVKFGPAPEITYTKEPKTFFKGIEIVVVNKHSVKSKDGSGYVEKLKRTKPSGWSFINLPIYLQSTRTSNKRETLMMQMHPEGFVKMKVQNVQDGFLEAEEMDDDNHRLWQKLKNDSSFLAEWESKQQTFSKFLRSSEEILIYEDIAIPGKDDPEEDEKEEETIIKGLTPAQLREIQGKTVCMYPIFSTWKGYEGRDFVWGKEEPVIKDLMLDDADIVYGFKEDEELIHMLAQMLTARVNDNSSEFYNANFRLVRISQAAAKYFKNHIYIKDFILSVNPDTKSIAMHSKLVKWHTGRKINEALSKMKFLGNFSRFNPTIAKSYDKLKHYAEENFRDVRGSSSFGCNEDMIKDLNEYANKVIDLQVYIAAHPENLPAIAAQARSLFDIPEGEDTFEIAVGTELEVYNELQVVLEYIKPLEHIFNYIKPLVDNERISDELETEIREIMHTKGII